MAIFKPPAEEAAGSCVTVHLPWPLEYSNQLRALVFLQKDARKKAYYDDLQKMMLEQREAVREERRKEVEMEKQVRSRDKP